ncbi:DUF6807 family protein [Rubinisphaera italica]|uniref:Methane oxygenase PmoA n=1 Tax=Rubinisphaera italica TaxID=2527969 RepID=A0A5C5XJ80_9PLAN|nr:DUF6807 family protein [Rubinisphaera italica]TWT62778.1 hypothetical protein Pan54_35230 [Rubinisphaera italica]
MTNTKHFLQFLMLMSIVYSGTVSEVSADDKSLSTGFQLQDIEGDHLDVTYNGKPVGRYMYDLDLSSDEKRHETYKPFLHVMNPTGEAPITKGAGGQFTHHRGIFRGWAKLKLNNEQYDTWHMKKVVQKHVRFTGNQSNAEEAAFTSVILYRTDDGKALFEEDRTMSFKTPPQGGFAMIDVTSIVKARQGKLTLDGDPEHAGLQFRPANEVEKSKTRYCFPKENADPKKDRDYPWVAESFVVEGKQYNVIYLNHPENTKGAIFSAYRDYGRFGAWFKTDIPEGASDTTQVRFVITEGEMPTPEFIQQQYNTYTGSDAPVPSVTIQ